MEESKSLFKQKDYYTHIINGLQECIIVVEGKNKIIFINQLCNEILSEITQMYNFMKGKKNKNDEQESSIDMALENKIFYSMKGVGQG